MKLYLNFYLKVAGLFGFIYTFINLLSFIVRSIDIQIINNQDITFSMFTQDKDITTYICTYIFFMIASIIIYFIGKSNDRIVADVEQKNPINSNQVVGLCLLVIGILQLSSIYYAYISYKSVYSSYNSYNQNDFVIRYYLSLIWCSLIPFVLLIIIGLLLMLVHKKVAFKDKELV